MWAIIPSLQISTPSAVLRFDSVVGRKPATAPLFYLIEERITPTLRKSITNVRKPLEVGFKLVVTLRHLFTRESYTSLQYHQRVGRTTICKFVPQVRKPFWKDFNMSTWCVPLILKTVRNLKKDLETDGMFPHAVNALDEKHVAIKKPNKSGRTYFNYKDYFFLVLLALVNADYRFLWVNARASGSSFDAQIFNCSKLKRRIENRTLGLPPPEPLGPVGPDLHFFLLGTMPLLWCLGWSSLTVDDNWPGRRE